MRIWRSDRGSALLEAALTIPLLLLVAVGIIEIGRAYQTWQVLTNAAREGARLAVIPNADPATVQGRVYDYMVDGQLPNADPSQVTVDRNSSITVGGSTEPASQVTIDYPFDYVMLGPVMRLVNPSVSFNGSATIRARALMRNEGT